MIDSVVYCQQQIILVQVIKEKHPELANRKGITMTTLEKHL